MACFRKVSKRGGKSSKENLYWKYKVKMKTEINAENNSDIIDF